MFVAIGLTGAAGLWAFIILLRQLYYICQPSEVLIFAGLRRDTGSGQTVGYRTVRGGSALRIPVVEEVMRPHDFLHDGDPQCAPTSNRAVPHGLTAPSVPPQSREDQDLTGLTDVIQLAQQDDECPKTGSTGEADSDEHQRSPELTVVLLLLKVARRSIPRIWCTCSKN